MQEDSNSCKHPFISGLSATETVFPPALWDGRRQQSVNALLFLQHFVGDDNADFVKAVLHLQVLFGAPE